MEKYNFNISFQDAKIIKAIAIILVITGHLGITKIGMWESGTLGVALFLTLSGYGLHESYKKNGLKDFWRKRITKVYVPYIIVMIIELVIDLIFLKRFYQPIKIIGIFLGRGEVLDGTMWYIFYLLLFYIAFWIIYKLVKNDSYLSIGALLVFGIIIGILWIVGIYNTPVLSGIYFPFFALGCLVSKLSYESKRYQKIGTFLYENKKIYRVLVIGVSLIIVALIYAANGKFNKIVAILYAVLSNYISTLLVLIHLILKQNKAKYMSVLSIIGENSYYLYLLEGVMLTKYRFAFQIFDNYYTSLIIYFLFLSLGTVIFRGIIKAFEQKIVR